MGDAMNVVGNILCPGLPELLEPVVGGIANATGGGSHSAQAASSGGMMGMMSNFLNPLNMMMPGFQNTGSISPFPMPFSPTGFNSGIFNNPLSSVFPPIPQSVKNMAIDWGQPQNIGLMTPGKLPTTVGDAPGTKGGAAESWSQLQADVKAAAQSGDPEQMMEAQQKMSEYQQMISLLSAMQKSQNDMIMSVVRNIA